MTFPVTEYLLSQRHNRYSRKRSNGIQFWGYPRRRGGTDAITCVGVHITASAPGTTASSVARWQAHEAPSPSSYHVLVDASTIVRTLEDRAVAFHIVGFNTKALGLSFAMPDGHWGRDPDADEQMLQRGAQQAAVWCKQYNIPPRWLTRSQAKRGVRGFIRHSVADPKRRRDPGKDFPDDRFFQLVKARLDGTPPPAKVPPTKGTTTEEEDVNELVTGIQQALATAGFDPGPVDGIWGPTTQAAFARALARTDRKTISQMADEVVAGQHGQGHDNRRNSLGLDAAGYAQVRDEVNSRY